MQKLRAAILCLSLALLLGACGKEKYKISYKGTWEGGDVNEFLADTKIYNPDGDETIPQLADGRAPFAIFYYLVADSKSYGTCSATHITPGRVGTAAHCLEDYFPNAEDYFVVYYNKDGKKRYAQMQDIEYSGSGDIFDMAILTIDSRTASDWDSLNGTPQDYSDQFSGSFLRNPDNPKKDQVVFHVFNPFVHHDNIEYDNEGEHGGVYEEKTGTLMRKAIKVARSSTSSALANNQFELVDWSTDEKHTGFVDKMSMPIVKGNSGGSILMANDPSKLVGVVSRFSYRDSSSALYHYGTSGRRVWSDVVSEQRSNWGIGDRDWDINYGGSTGELDYYLTSHVMVTIFDSLSEFQSIFTNFFAFRTP